MKDHSHYLTFHEGASSSKAKLGNKGSKDKALLKVCEGRIHKEQRCFFYWKAGHIKKNCPKRKKWFKKKGNYRVSVIFESNLIEVPHNTWWLNFSATTHMSHVMHGFLSI